MRVIVAAEAWCEERGFDLRTIGSSDLAAWVDTVPRTTSSRRMARTALGHYWRIHERDRPPLWVVRVPRKGRGVCRALEPDEATRLAKVARQRGDRPGLAVLFGLHVALRCAEIAAVRWPDLDAEGWLHIVGKREQTAVLPVHRHVLDALEEVGRADDVWVFPGRFGGAVTPATVWNWCKSVASDAGVANLSPHRLRHTALATANDATGDLRAVQEFARHLRPETTALYTRATAKRLTAVMQAIDYDAP